MSLEALIFDVDGTLAETEEAHREAFNRVFTEKGLDWHWSCELYRDLLKVTGGKERIRHYLASTNPPGGEPYEKDDDLVIAMHKRKTDIYMDLVSTGQVPLRPGIERLILEARAEGVKLSIATTTNILPLSALFEGTLGKKAMAWFSAIAAGDMVPNKKPAPDVYRLALQGLGLAGPQCLAFEDTRNGVQAAKGAKIPVLVTVSEYSRGQNFTGAIGVLDHLGEPNAPFSRLAGPRELLDKSKGLVDLQLARSWHDHASS